MPAIDLLDGQVVRVQQGDLNRAIVYSSNPLETAEKFARSGATIIHVVDLNAAVKSDPRKNEKTIEQFLTELGDSVKFQIAGGIRNSTAASSLIDRGAARIVIGSVAYSAPQIATEILGSLGKNKVVLALDYDNTGYVKTSGWTKAEWESALNAISRFSKLGFTNFLMTSIERDGMMKGPDFENLGNFRRAIDEQGKIIASGGVTTIEDFSRLSHIGIDEVIIGKGFYEETIPISVLGQTQQVKS
ncbi:MAG TPA: 1-(5-phosphoribosyl)-5-[(5-phosphoribosylamino)methylideneamino] imidazole-4-carboxamide isomerase [Nitrososphaerales archaeon]|nr:1-(5-phosphoribosyl)-5-[(5-phosphoribosylamino)methylideneamino] imidazole-4-carboxamide isomerase [Nitrososphaerales archaeon]